MKSVYKYNVSLDYGSAITLEMPVGADILHVGAQAVGGGEQGLFLWALVDPSQPSENVPLWVAATGAPVPANVGEHLGTALLYDGDLVFHVFKRKES